MWIAIRLVFASLILSYRLIRKVWPPRRAGDLPGGAPYFVKLRKRKSRVLGFRLGTRLAAPWFRLHRESGVDRRFKALGLSAELQTGDAAFDEAVYVAGDHPSLHHLLRTDPALREKIRFTLASDNRRITSAGGILWLEYEEGREPTPADVRWLEELRALLLPLRLSPSRWLPHPFWWTALIIETVIWSIFAYAVPSAMAAVGYSDDEHLFHGKLVAHGLLVALGMFALLLGAIVVFLRRSSRGHRVLVESALLLMFGLPVVGTQLVADLNRELDRAAPVTLKREIAQIERRQHRGRKGRIWYSYHLHLAAPRTSEPIAFPDSLEVSRATFALADPGREMVLEIGPGWLGHPWRRKLTIR